METEKMLEAVNKGLDVVGKDVYVIEHILRDKPIVKRIHISCFKCFGAYVQLETDHEGSYLVDGIGKTIFLTREEADKKLNELLICLC